MTCSPALPLERTDELADIAALLSGRTVLSVERQPGGGNNRLFRVALADGAAALKCYDRDGAARLSREFEGLCFLAAAGCGTAPRPMAADPALGAALYEWIDGGPVSRDPDGRRLGDLEEVLAFLGTLAGLRHAMGADRLTHAAEACLSARELVEQVTRRLDALAALPGEPDLHRLLRRGLRPALDRAAARLAGLYAGAGLDPDAEIAPGARTLSPSDFGFHNALRRADGTLLFLDFEYFGWDDPAKLASDFLWHPAFALSEPEQAAWLEGMDTLFGTDPGFAVRLNAQLPLYGLRWCAILLNEFLPARWQRRVFAGTAGDWPAAKARQLARAELWLGECLRLLDPASGPVAGFLPLLPKR